MTADELAAIRERDATSVFYPETFQVVHDRRALLRAYDALLAAAGKVECAACNDVGVMTTHTTKHPEWVGKPCPDCADLREILGRNKGDD